MGDPVREQLRDWLEMTVPLRMAELRDRAPEQLAAVGRAQAVVVGAQGDVLQYGGRGAAAAAAALATGLAAAALTSEGGVTFAGLHWCCAPHEGCTSRTPQWKRLGVYELPAPAPARRPVTDVALPDHDQVMTHD